jgi:site-specific recombinase XerD
MKKGETYPVEILNRQEVLDLLAACSRRAPTGIRNRALIAVLWRCGLRVSEALALKPADIDDKHRSVRVRHGKGDKARTVGIDAQTLDTIAAWLEVRKTFKISASKPLFCQITKGSEGQPIDSSYIRHLLPRLAEKAGITKRVHAHGLRHTHAVELLRDEKKDVVTIQGVLGHSSVAVTNTYLAHLNPQQVIDAVRDRVW